MKFLIPVLVGAVIGYFTNWLAIKMLFRPYEEKYIGSFKLPFTPGLIPKEQKRIAENVGQTVSDYLLSEEIIMEKLSDREVEEAIEKGLESYLEKIAEEDKCLGDLLEPVFLDQELEKLEDLLLDNLILYLESDQLVESLKTLILREGPDYKECLGRGLNLLEKLAKDQDFEGQLEERLRSLVGHKIDSLRDDTRKLGDILDREGLNDLVDENINEILIFGKKILDDRDLEYRIKKVLEKGLEENMPKALKLFVSEELMRDKIYELFRDFLRSPEASIRMIPVIKGLVNKALELDLKSSHSLIDRSLSKEERDRLVGLVLKKISSEESRLELRTYLEELILKNEKLLDQLVEEKLLGIYGQVVRSKVFKELVKNGIRSFRLELEGLALSKLINLLGESKKKEILVSFRKFIVDIIRKEMPRAIKAFNVSKVVEDEINSFEMDFAEKIILDIASKELRAITWLGALLGAVMGLLSPLLQNIV